MEDAYRGLTASVEKEEMGRVRAFPSNAKIITPTHCLGLTLSDLKNQLHEGKFDNTNCSVRYT